MPPQTPESWPVFSAQLRHSVSDRAPITDQFRVSDLRKCRTTVSYREEQFRILVTTDRLVAPIH